MLPQRVHLELFCLQDRRRDPITSLANKQEEELCDVPSNTVNVPSNTVTNQKKASVPRRCLQANHAT